MTKKLSKEDPISHDTDSSSDTHYHPQIDDKNRSALETTIKEVKQGIREQERKATTSLCPIAPLVS